MSKEEELATSPFLLAPIKQAKRERPCDEDGALLNMRLLAVKHLYRLGYRITGDGRFSRPFHGIERIPKRCTSRLGMTTRVVLKINDEVRTIDAPLSHLAVASFHGFAALEEGGQVVFNDGDPTNLRKSNITFKRRKPKRSETYKLTKREATWAAKRQVQGTEELRERIGHSASPLVNTQLCLTVFAAVEGKIATVAQVATKLAVSPDMVFSMMAVARAHKAQEANRARQLRDRTVRATV